MSVIAIAHHPYEASQEDEISFNKDDRIKVTDHSDPDWWVGTLESTGASGLFPSNFVSVVTEQDKAEDKPVESVRTEQTTNEEQEKKEEVQADEGKEKEQQQQEEEVEEEKVPEKKDSIIGMARVMEDYAMQESGEISLHRGGIINVYEVIDNEWSRGELNGKVGRYPSKYVEDIDMPGRPDFGMKTSDASVKKEEEGGFKLAAFGVKQGGIGSLFGGGFPGLKKTNAKPSEPVESKPPTASVPSVPAVPATKPTEPPAEVPKPPAEVPKPVVEEKKPESPLTEPESAKKSLGKAIVLHPYDADNEDELSLLRGEYVDILDREADDGWWEGKNERGEVGVFPSNFVKELQEDVVSPPPPTRRSINTPTSPIGQLPPIPQNSRPIPNRPVTIQPSSNSRSIAVPSVPRPSSVNSPAPVSTPPIARAPPSVPEQKNVLPVANVDQEDVVGIVQPEPVKQEEKKEEVVVEEEEEKVEPPAEEEEEPVKPQPEIFTPEPVKEVVTEEPASPESVTKPLDEPEPVKEEEPVVEEPKVEEQPAVAEEEVEEEKKVEEPVVETKPEEEEKVEEPVKEEEEEEKKEEEDKADLDNLQPTGPKLTTPSRARIGGNRARRTPTTPSSEPSQTEVLQKELEQMPEPEKKQPVSPPPKPVKPIFAKFPTPFATGEEITKHQLKPVTRRPWEVKQEQQDPPAAATSSNNEDEAPVRPTGVKNLASRFNFGGVPSSGGNEVLETKLKNHTKNEVEKVRKEFEVLLQEEREKRTLLEEKVAVLMERLEALEK